MKKNKLLNIFVCLIVMVCSLCMVGCKEEYQQTPEKALEIFDGFRIQSVEVFYVNDNEFNAFITITNTNDEFATFDGTQIKIFYLGEELQHDLNDILLEAGQTAEEKPVRINAGDINLSAGDTVQIYYQDTLIKEVVVSEF